MFYTFNQNNSGGRFDRTNTVDEYVIIEADNVAQVEWIAEDIGIYFNGVTDGRDCPCCGSRWFYADTPTEVPSLYSTPLVLNDVSDVKNPRVHTVVIHYRDKVVYTTRETTNHKLNHPSLAVYDEDESERY
jgi:hypothetical protein